MNSIIRNPRKILIMRHGERTDLVFQDWFEKSFDSQGKYIRHDLNMALTLPKRQNINDYRDDCPLTRIGNFQGTLYGETLLENQFDIQHVFCSPALRSIQTCDAILRGANKTSIPIAIEPGLFDPGFLSKTLPNWMTTDELTQAGFKIQSDYKPILGIEVISTILKENSSKSFFQRLESVFEKLLKNMKDKDGNILIVSHLGTNIYSLYQKFGLDVQIEDCANITKIDTFCSYLVLKEKELENNDKQKGEMEIDKWELIDCGFPTFKHNSREIYHWRDFLLKCVEILKKPVNLLE